MTGIADVDGFKIRILTNEFCWLWLMGDKREHVGAAFTLVRLLAAGGCDLVAMTLGASCILMSVVSTWHYSALFTSNVLIWHNVNGYVTTETTLRYNVEAKANVTSERTLKPCSHPTSEFPFVPNVKNGVYANKSCCSHLTFVFSRTCRQR